MKNHLIKSLAIAAVAFTTNAFASQVLFKNVNIFDGKNEQLKQNHHVLVVDNEITKISKDKIVVAQDAVIIDGSNKTLMPGMIDVHAHLAITTALSKIHGYVSPEENAIRSTLTAKTFIDDGFTTVRDAGGHTFALKRLIDQGLVPGPRIYPSGAFISQTSGHGDFRTPAEPHASTGHVDAGHRLKMGKVVDGKAEIYRAVRENLRQGATQIKIMASGGAGSDFDPLDSLQFQPEEQLAAVNAAKDWGTYVTAHLLTDAAISRALDSGVMGVEHGLMIKERGMKKLVEKGAFLATQFNATSPRLTELPGLQQVNIDKIVNAQKDMANLVPLIKKYQPKIPFAVDAFGPPSSHIKQRRYELYWGAELFGNFDTLKRATSVSAEFVALSGKRNPYGKLGVIEEGALADILLIDGNPLEDISLVGADAGWWDASTEDIKTILVIMKDGKFHKNTL
ncbi:amidohydrolase family protein [Thalassotalea nanhaiensis]|uniref:Amidohydrolase family protein n=1 Tax=Thalassotalea nanhaiensis TaxID=3065648 RepID=A0ABY9TEX2_9GAMM|nr:amidohydrolase family protein [Colwelliaceae bacterium SQ345]